MSALEKYKRDYDPSVLVDLPEERPPLKPIPMTQFNDRRDPRELYLAWALGAFAGAAICIAFILGTSSCTPVMRAHYRVERPAAILDAVVSAGEAANCGTSDHGIVVEALPPAECPQIEAVDWTISRVAQAIDVDANILDGALLIIEPYQIYCAPEHQLAPEFARHTDGCTIFDEQERGNPTASAAMFIQDHAPIGWGFPYYTFRDEIGHVIALRLDLPDFTDPDNHHQPALWWDKVRGQTGALEQPGY